MRLRPVAVILQLAIFLQKMQEEVKIRNMNKAIIFIIFIIIIAGVSAAGYWYWQGQQYSKEVLKVDILGPDQIQAGEEVEYLVKFKNNGNVRLEQPELIFQYPDNAFPVEGKELRITEEIEDIYPGEERVVSFKAHIFGKEGDVLKAETWLSYQPKNLTARYESKTSLTTQIKTVPFTFEFDLPLKVEQGERIDFSLNYFSNIDYLLENLRVKIEYPDGFEFLSSKPTALDNTDWDLPVLTQADGGRIQIEGILDGNEGAKKAFKAQIGLVNNNQFVLLKESSQSVEIVEPSLYISQLINGSQNYPANVGDMLHYEIFFKNIGRSPIQKKFLFVKLDSDFFDLNSLKSDKGEFGRGDNSIIWDWKVVPSLKFLDSNDEGKVDFWVNVKDGSAGRKIKNPLLQNKVTVAGTDKLFEIKINSGVELEQKVYYQEEVFGNSGPLPPQIDQKTTYTVFWQIENSWNDLENVKVKTQLPSSVSVTGRFFPDNAKFTFDSQSREVLWNVSKVDAFQGSGEEGSPLTLAFQIEFVPDAFQRGRTPWLVKDTEIIGTDSFTLDIIEEKADGVNTTLPDDQTVSSGQGIVE